MLTGAIGGRSKADTREPKTLFSTCQKRQRGSANLDQAALGGWATPSRGIVFVDDLETASDHDVALNGLNLPLASSCALADASARRRPPRRSYSLQLTAYGIRLTRYCRRLLLVLLCHCRCNARKQAPWWPAAARSLWSYFCDISSIAVQSIPVPRAFPMHSSPAAALHCIGCAGRPCPSLHVTRHRWR